MNRSHLDLCAGIGGFSLASHWAGVETVGFAEIDPYASQILAKRWPDVINYGDIRNVPALKNIWLVSAGFPCQPYSIAGRRDGNSDDRAIWPEVRNVIERIRPAWIILENVVGLLSLEEPVMSLDLEGYGRLVETAVQGESDFWPMLSGEVEFLFRDIISSVEALGYSVQPIIVPACGVGAPHRRYRVWIVGHAKHDGRATSEKSEGAGSRTDASARESEAEQSTGPDSGGVGQGDAGNSDSAKRRTITEGRYEPNGNDAGRKEAASGFESSGETAREGSVAHTDELQPRPGQQPTGNNKAGHRSSEHVPERRNGNVRDSDIGRESAKVSKRERELLIRTEPDRASADVANAGRSGRKRRRAGSGQATTEEILDMRITDGSETVPNALNSGQRELLQSKRLRGSSETSNLGSNGETRIVSDAEYASPEGQRKHGREVHAEPASSGSDISGGNGRRTVEPRLGRALNELPARMDEPWSGEWESGVPRVATGVKNRVDRLRCLGNAVVPQIPYLIIKAMIESEH